jgi:hypothetical protein
VAEGAPLLREYVGKTCIEGSNPSGSAKLPMDREGISKIRRAELLARLEALDQQVRAQAARAKHVRDMGWNATLSEQRLKALQDSRQLYLFALKHLLGEELVDGEVADGGSAPPSSP